MPLHKYLTVCTCTICLWADTRDNVFFPSNRYTTVPAFSPLLFPQLPLLSLSLPLFSPPPLLPTPLLPPLPLLPLPLFSLYPYSLPWPSSHPPPTPLLPFPSRMQSSKMDLLCAVGLMGAPTALDEKSVNIPETVTALHQLEKTLTSEVCDHEAEV